MIVLRPQDRVPVQIGEITFWLSPLTYQQRTELLSTHKVKSGEEQVDNSAFTFLSLRMSLKRVDNVQLANGEPFVVQHDERGLMTEDCAETVLQLGCTGELLGAVGAVQFAQDSLPKLVGITVDFSKTETVKKN